MRADKAHWYIPCAFGLLFARGLYAEYRRRPASLEEARTLRAEDEHMNMGHALTKPGFSREALRDFKEMADVFERLAGRSIK